MVEEICLSGKLDLNAAAMLHSQLLAARDKDICVDITDVTLFGTLAVQTCLVAARGAQDRGKAFEIRNASDEVKGQLTCLGLTPQMLSEGRT